MNLGGDAIDQSMRVVIEGTEVALKLSGAAAKHIAVLLYTLLNQPKPTKGKVGLTKMLKSGKPLDVFSVRNRELQTFVQEAKRYGISYHALFDRESSPDGMTDIFAYKEDAARINRIMERFQLGTVERAEEPVKGATIAETISGEGEKERPLSGQKDRAAPSGSFSEMPTSRQAEKTPPEKASVRTALREIKEGQGQSRAGGVLSRGGKQHEAR